MEAVHNVTTEYDLNEVNLNNLLKTIGYYPGDKPSLPTTQVVQPNGPIIDGLEFLRINNSISKDDQLQKKIRQNEKEYLHKRSQDRIKNWKNTITGQRRIKLEKRKKEMEELEEKRKKENEIFLEKEKKRSEEMMEKLKQIRIQELDSVKAFNSKLRYFEVQKERKLQIEKKKLRQKIQEEYDRQVDEHYKELKKMEAEEDKLKLNEKLKEAKIIDDYNQALRNKRKIEKALLKQEELKEQEKAIKKDKEEKEKKKIEELKEKEKQKVLYENFKQKEIENRMKKDRMKLIEEETLNEINQYIEKKKLQDELRQQREIELRNKNNPNKEYIYKLLENDNIKKKKAIEDFQTKWLNVEDMQTKSERERERKDAQFKKELYNAYLEKMEEKRKKKELQEKKSLEISKILKEYDECTKKMEQYKNDQKKLEIEQLAKLNKILKEEQSERKKKYKEDRNAWRQLIKENQDQERKDYEEYIKSIGNLSWAKENEPLQRYIKDQLDNEVSTSGSRRYMYGNINTINNTWERLGFTDKLKTSDMKLSSQTVGSHEEYLKNIENKKYIPINYESKDFH
ncbi:hypothetical protein BCR36DRAFT_410835 [Piromyces finnis]|uniref:Trichohyalin-plectin-homology domain-containing protein n=1 Tax=Piromyces finnis TaxID=1754191 RepID=A0A1Y1VFS4_9FUNG|nr:hypothetical protein BCR36DRAFT_410835 [Piromyces finnis]|eukprot:ORX54292.1 hypothetical protein BCR36DRAFT_410835 [Piromyces finnis]